MVPYHKTAFQVFEEYYNQKKQNKKADNKDSHCQQTVYHLLYRYQQANKRYLHLHSYYQSKTLYYHLQQSKTCYPHLPQPISRHQRYWHNQRIRLDHLLQYRHLFPALEHTWQLTICVWDTRHSRNPIRRSKRFSAITRAMKFYVVSTIAIEKTWN